MSFPPSDDADFLLWLNGSEMDCASEESLLHHYESFLYGLMVVTKEKLHELDRAYRSDSFPALILLMLIQ